MIDMDLLLSKYFAQEASPSERKVVEAWKKDHPHAFEEARKLYAMASRVDYTPVDTERALQKLNLTDPKQSISFYPRISLALKVAAGVALLIGLFFLWPDRNDNDAVEMVSYVSEHSGSSVLLADGTEVKLNRGAQLHYPLRFKGDKRVVQLYGDAFFAVAKNPKRPFIIDHALAQVEVLGTSFDISSDSNNFHLDVVTGRVALSNQLSRQSDILEAGYSGHVFGTNLVKSQTQVSNRSSWRTKKLQFSEAPFKDVVQDLRDFYGSNIVMKDVDQANCLLSASFENRPITEVFEILELTCQLKIKSTKDGYIVLSDEH